MLERQQSNKPHRKMLKEETLAKYQAEWLPVFQEATSEAAIKRAITLLIKDVERDTRHAACDQVALLQNKLHNLRH